MTAKDILKEVNATPVLMQDPQNKIIYYSEEDVLKAINLAKHDGIGSIVHLVGDPSHGAALAMYEHGLSHDPMPCIIGGVDVGMGKDFSKLVSFKMDKIDNRLILRNITPDNDKQDKG